MDLQVNSRGDNIGWRGVSFECAKCGVLNVPVGEMLEEPDDRVLNCRCGRKMNMVARGMKGYWVWEVDTVGEVRERFEFLLSADTGKGEVS